MPEEIYKQVAASIYWNGGMNGRFYELFHMELDRRGFPRSERGDHMEIIGYYLKAA